MRHLLIAIAACASLIPMSAAAQTRAPQTADAPVAPARSYAALLDRRDPVYEAGRAMAARTLTSEAIVRGALARIADPRIEGQINAVIAVTPDAITQARRLDAERRAGRVRGPLHGVPVLIKDNIEVAGPLPTTAGSLALAQNVTNRDAPLVARLRAAGAVILGKANLSEWANIRSENSSSGWSAVGGLTRNPHDLSRTACGSSSGSGAGVAAGLALAAIGTETNGSITCPAGVNGIAGFKPTVGLVSRTHVVPISGTQDTAGPMTLSVRDAALVLDAIAGSDPADAATREADARRGAGYAAGLRPDGLRGLRIGVVRGALGRRADIVALFDAALARMRGAGATIVELTDEEGAYRGLGEAETALLMSELRGTMDEYLRTRPAGVPGPRSLDEVIAFNRREAARELRYFGQDSFERAARSPALDSAEYRRNRDTAVRLATTGLDRLLSGRAGGGAPLDMILGVTNGPGWSIDLLNGDNFAGPSSSGLPAIAGYPHLTVPMGTVEGMPIGLSFIGAKWSDAQLLSAGAAYEALAPMRPRPTFRSGLAPERAAPPVARLR